MIEAYGREIFALAVPLLGWVLTSFFSNKAKLVIARPHGFVFLVQEPLHDSDGNVVSPSQTIETRSYVLSNAGRAPASNVEVVLNWEPKCVNIWPVRHCESRKQSDGRYSLSFNSLAPGEVLGIEFFSINSQAPEVLVARCDQCTAKIVAMAPQPIVAQWKIRLAFVLMTLGASAAIFLGIALLQFLVLKTPYGV